MLDLDMVDSVYFNRRREPPAGRVLHGAGQSDEAFLEYTKRLRPDRETILNLLRDGVDM